MTNKNKKIKQKMTEINPLNEEFTYIVKKCGGSSHISLGKKWLGKLVKVKVEEINDD